MTICKHGVPSWVSPPCEDCAAEREEIRKSHPCTRCGRAAVAHSLCDKCLELHMEVSRETEADDGED